MNSTPQRFDKTPFVKMEGAGNDFVVFDGRHSAFGKLGELAPSICNRRFGVGADGVLCLEPSTRADFRVVYFNADGSRSVCGNGTRCIASYVYQRGLIANGNRNFTLETDDRIVAVDVIGGGDKIRVDMGSPIFEGQNIPTASVGEQIAIGLLIEGREITLTAVSMGNPHAVIFVDDLRATDLMRIGQLVENHPFFPQRTNVEFVKVISPHRVEMRVWERGVGETLACGTGNCAVLAAGVREGRLERQITLQAPGGEFQVSWKSENNRIQLTGPAREVFSGTIDLVAAMTPKT